VLLRVSGSATKTRVDLTALIGDESTDCGVDHGADLRQFALAIVRGGTPEDGLADRRSVLADNLGADAVVDAAAVAAFFNAFDRVADATGTDPDPPTMDLIGQWLPDLATQRSRSDDEDRPTPGPGAV
jgi:hypothetical protein